VNKITRWEGNMEVRAEKKSQDKKKKNQRSATKKNSPWYYVG
jgi:hypothetical protein